MFGQWNPLLLVLTSAVVCIKAASISSDDQDINFVTRLHLRNLTESFIHGGEFADLGELPYQISLRYYGTHNCGGSILSPKWIVTAAHCVPNSGNPSRYTVLAGTLDKYNTHRNGQLARVERIIVHPDYVSHLTGSDIALVKLRKPLKLNDNVDTIGLPNSSHRAEGKTLISGWGQTEIGETSYLKKVVLDLYSDEDCKRDYRGHVKVLPQMICGGDRSGVKSGCFGDSGGPWVDLEKKVIIALVSFGPETCKSKFFPDVSTEIAYFSDWIEDTMKSSGIMHSYTAFVFYLNIILTLMMLHNKP